MSMVHYALFKNKFGGLKAVNVADRKVWYWSERLGVWLPSRYSAQECARLMEPLGTYRMELKMS